MDPENNSLDMVNSDSSKTANSFPGLSNARGLIIFILIVLITGGLVSFSLSSRGGDKKVPVPLPSNAPQVLPSGMIIFGVWKDSQSVIKGYDISLKKEYLLAKLPFNIKKVTVLSSFTLLYIGETNNKDHGKNLSIYNLSTKKSTIIYKADENFGIDDYVVSKDKRYIALWEVSFSSGSYVLLGGRSRVIALWIPDQVGNDSLSSGNLIYDEAANTPVHYPRAITQNGTIFFDTFLPNSGAGWSYGMSISNFTGTQKQDLSSMKNATYATQPSISPNEDYLVFSGYSPSDGATIDNGFRKALISPNTIELLNTQTLQRTKLPNISSENIYPMSYFDEQTGNIILSLISKDTAGTYSYNLKTNLLVKIPTQNSFISYVSANSVLVGNKSQTVSSLGNLGDSYSSSYSNFSILNNQTNQTSPLKLTDNFMQFISIAPPNFFENMKEIDTLSDKTLQLQTFNFKPSLAPKREGQQSELIPPDDTPVDSKPPCLQLLLNQCANMNSSGNDIRSQQRATQCRHDMEIMSNQGICSDSPLYLYGKAGTLVNIKVKTYVYSSNPLYDERTGYNVSLLENGKMEVDGKIYNRINYDYISQKVSKPEYGTVVSLDKLRKTLIYYSQNLGLNQKETDDLVQYGINNIKSPYVFISFYDQKTSEQILPLEFIPKPDTYINIVFYFREYNQNPSTTPLSPIFKTPPQRTGLTAVEVSEIKEK